MIENLWINVAVFSMACVCLWYLYFELFKDYIVDSYRQEVFCLRDDLFDFAASGNIDFKHPAYCVLRRKMNGYIRFSHRITLLDMLVIGCMAGISNIKKSQYQTIFEKQFEVSLATLDESVSEKLMKYNSKSRYLLLRYLIFSSPVLSAVVFLTVLPLGVFCAFCYSRIKELVTKLAMIQIKNIESEAFSLGKLS